MTDLVLEPRKVRHYGWRPDLPDDRDFLLTEDEVSGPLPESVDLRTTGHFSDPYNQLDLGSCTGNGIAAIVDFVIHLLTGKFLFPSRLFIYWGERFIENTVNEDSGAMIRDGIQVVAKQGVPPESEWPYDIAQFKTKPSAKAFADAVKHEALTYKRVARSLIQAALAKGYPVVFGFSVYASFESQEVAKTGIVPMPSRGEQLLGGHCVVAVGYKTINGQVYVICRNSWGKGWGDGGYFYMPLAYFTKRGLTSDFWTITNVGAQSTAAKAA